jgi:hypothetical protein
MRPFRWRIWFWFAIVAGTLAIAGLSAWLLIQHRYEIEVWWYRKQLSQVSTAEEAEPLMRRFATGRGAAERCAIFWRTFAQTDVHADYWALLALFRTDDEQPAVAVRAFVAESQKRPEICEGYLHWSRWLWGSFDATIVHEARSMLNDFFQSSDELTDVECVYATFILRLLCWGTCQDELCRDLEPENWRHVFEQWNRWYEENGPYLRFEPDIGRYRVDEDARLNKHRVPPEARHIPPVDEPLPGWTGPLPTKE